MSGMLGFIRPGFGEWMIILVIVLVIFGPKRLPGLGEAVGKTIKGFRKAMSEGKSDDAEKLDEKKDQGSPKE